MLSNMGHIISACTSILDCHFNIDGIPINWWSIFIFTTVGCLVFKFVGGVLK